VDLRITLGTNAPSLSRPRLLRIQEHHSLRLDHQVRSRNHQATPLHLDVNHFGASSATGLGTLLETADRSSPLPWNTKVTTGPHHSRIISSSRRIRILRTTRTSRSQMTWTSHIQKKLQQPQLTDRPDRHMGHVHHQDQQRPPHHQCRSLDPRHLLSLVHLLLPTRLFHEPVGNTMLLDARGVFSPRHQHTIAKLSLPFAKIVTSTTQSLLMPVWPTARMSLCQSPMASLRTNQFESFETLDVPPSSYEDHLSQKPNSLVKKQGASSLMEPFVGPQLLKSFLTHHISPGLLMPCA